MRSSINPTKGISFLLSRLQTRSGRACRLVLIEDFIESFDRITNLRLENVGIEAAVAVAMLPIIEQLEEVTKWVQNPLLQPKHQDSRQA